MNVSFTIFGDVKKRDTRICRYRASCSGGAGDCGEIQSSGFCQLIHRDDEPDVHDEENQGQRELQF